MGFGSNYEVISLEELLYVNSSKYSLIIHILLLLLSAYVELFACLLTNFTFCMFS